MDRIQPIHSGAGQCALEWPRESIKKEPGRGRGSSGEGEGERERHAKWLATTAAAATTAAPCMSNTTDKDSIKIKWPSSSAISVCDILIWNTGLWLFISVAAN